MKDLFFISIVGFILFSVRAQSQVTVKDTIFLTSFSDSVSLDEVVVKGSKIPKMNSRWSDMQPVDLVTVGGANGNLYQALKTLPGTQLQGESGRLLVRGGSSDETQTYIDGMHVLNPYTTTGVNTPARGRYSPFMFSGINLSTGGYSQEYGEALSAVLPLETKDNSPINKWGINPSTIGIGSGGNHSFRKGSVALNLDYQNLAPYNKVYSGRIDFEKPYEMFTGATQFRYLPAENIIFKIYAGYDRTDFSNYTADDHYLFSLKEDNVYLNATIRAKTSSGWNWFAGVAYSFFDRKIDGAAVSDDNWSERQSELHLKAKLTKRLYPFLQLDMGVESFLRRYRTHYSLAPFIDQKNITPTLEAGFVAATLYPLENLRAELSFRTEYTSLNRKMNYSPRLALCYNWNGVILSATAGRYTQSADNKYLAQQPSLHSEVCEQYNVGALYEAAGRFYKVEAYYKKYNRLALFTPDGLTSDGYGNSKGIDFYFEDRSLLKNFEYYLSYSFTVSKRKYLEYNELTTPQYATRHNASLVLKYSVPKLRTIISLTEGIASGRPYHNPNRPGLMNDEAKLYNSLDFGITFLATKKIIAYASATNILCRKNEFGRVDGIPLRASSDHFFYLGVFITLGKKAAYDVSNF